MDGRSAQVDSQTAGSNSESSIPMPGPREPSASSHPSEVDFSFNNPQSRPLEFPNHAQSSSSWRTRYSRMVTRGSVRCACQCTQPLPFSSTLRPGGLRYTAATLKDPLSSTQELESDPSDRIQKADPIVTAMASGDTTSHFPDWLTQLRDGNAAEASITSEKVLEFLKVYRSGSTIPPTQSSAAPNPQTISSANTPVSVFPAPPQEYSSDVSSSVPIASRDPSTTASRVFSLTPPEVGITGTTEAGIQNVAVSDTAVNVTINVNGAIISGLTILSGQEIVIHQLPG